MPENKNLEQQKAADDAAKVAADKAEADKKAADEAEANKNKNKNQEETVTVKKSDWDKTQSDLENYRTGLINKKKNERNLDGNTEVIENKNSSALDEKKVEEIATKASMAMIHKRNEKSAIAQFLKKNPDYVDDNNWKDLLPYLPASINRDDELAIVDAMEGAVLLHKRATGKLDEHLAAQREVARRDAEMDAQVNLGRNAGGNGQRTNQDNKTDKVSESTVEMGRKFGHDEAKITESLKEIKRSPEGAYEIDPRTSKKSSK